MIANLVFVALWAAAVWVFVWSSIASARLTDKDRFATNGFLHKAEIEILDRIHIGFGKLIRFVLPAMWLVLTAIDLLREYLK